MRIVTHSGKFHADDVLAWSLLCHFHPNGSTFTLERTRDNVIQAADNIVFDVGGIYDPMHGRFDHHQNEYSGPLSSAGMMLQWLTESGWIPKGLDAHLKQGLVSYVDDVDNGRVEEIPRVPCFSRMVNLFNASANTLEDFDVFHHAAQVATGMIVGFEAQFNQEGNAKRLVLSEMTRDREFANLMEFPDTYLGKVRRTIKMMDPIIQHNLLCFHPCMENGRYQQFHQPLSPSIKKKSFPLEWAGLRDEELSAVTGVPSVFCHKNRFIAVFETRDAAISAMNKFNLLS